MSTVTSSARVAGKVVLVTGGARGQGRSHAVKLAEEGADVILFDICHDIETNEYPLATSRDLEEAGLGVEKTGHKAYTAEVDVRDRAAVSRELANAVAEFGKLDVVVANAGICPLGAQLPVQAFASGNECIEQVTDGRNHASARREDRMDQARSAGQIRQQVLQASS